MSESTLLEKYPELAALGYIEPGPDDTHLVAIIVCQDGPDGREYLVIEYDSGEGTQVKFAAGTNNDHPKETPEQTARREFPEETWLTLPDRIRWIWAGARTKNKDGLPGFHQKLALIVQLNECGGQMRTTPLDDQGDKLSPPFWRTEAELLVDVGMGGLFWTHRPMLHSAKMHRF